MFLKVPKQLIFSFKTKSIKTVKSTGATFLNGEHYLVDAIGNLMRVNEKGDLPTLIANGHSRM